MNKKFLILGLLLALLLTSTSAFRFLQEESADLSDDQPVNEQPVVDQPAEEQPAEEQPVDEQPVDQPVDEQPVDEQPVDEQPVDDTQNDDDLVHESEVCEINEEEDIDLNSELDDDQNPNQNNTNSNNTNTHNNSTDNLSEALSLYYLPDFIRVTGRALRQLKNDQFSIKLTVETLDLLASNSVSYNAIKMNNTVEELKNLGLNETEFSTSDYTVQPIYRQEYVEDKKIWRKIYDGIQVRNSLSIRSDKIDLVGQVIDAAINNGVNVIDNIDFYPSQQSILELRKQLLGEAIANGQAQAQEIVDNIGFRIKSIKGMNVLDSAGNSPIPLFAADDTSALEKLSSPIFGSTDKIELDVEMTFIIEEIEE